MTCGGTTNQAKPPVEAVEQLLPAPSGTSVVMLYDALRRSEVPQMKRNKQPEFIVPTHQSYNTSCLIVLASSLRTDWSELEPFLFSFDRYTARFARTFKPVVSQQMSDRVSVPHGLTSPRHPGDYNVISLPLCVYCCVLSISFLFSITLHRVTSHGVQRAEVGSDTEIKQSVIRGRSRSGK